MDQLMEGGRIVIASIAIAMGTPFLLYVLARVITLAYFMSKADYLNRLEEKRIKGHG